MSISKDHYSLFILDPEDRVIPCEKNTFKLDHEQQYKVMIYNHNPRKRINAEIMIDGKKVGLFRVDAKSSAVVERPTDDRKTRKLTFYALQSKEGRMASLTLHDNLGKIDVNISIETNRNESELDWATSYVEREEAKDEIDGVGGTGLGATSCQKFRTAQPIEVEERKIHLSGRMVLNDTAAMAL